MQLVSNSSEYQRWAERAKERAEKPIDFTKFSPLIRLCRYREHPSSKWVCVGEGPNGDAWGYGRTPGEAYEKWTKYKESEIPF